MSARPGAKKRRLNAPSLPPAPPASPLPPPAGARPPAPEDADANDAFERDELPSEDESPDFLAGEDELKDGSEGEDEDEDDDDDFEDDGDVEMGDVEMGERVIEVTRGGFDGAACETGGPGRNDEWLKAREDVEDDSHDFEVNELESSGEEDDNEIENGDGQDDDWNRYEVDELPDESADDCDEDDEEDEDDDEDDDDDESASGGASDASAKRPMLADRGDGTADYQRFLQALLVDDDRSTALIPSAGSNLLDDDVDDDFDYLTAAAAAVEDPLEFRDDKAVVVSRREIVSLVTPHQRARRARATAPPAAPGVAVPRGLVPIPGVPMTFDPAPYAEPVFSPPGLAPLSPPHVPHYPSEVTAAAVAPAARVSAPPVLPAPIRVDAAVPSAQASTGATASASRTRLVTAPALLVPSGPLPTPYALKLAPTPSAQGDHTFWAAKVPLLEHQLKVMIVLAGHIHCRAEDSKPKEMISAQIRELASYRDLSRSYKQIFEPVRRKFEEPFYSGGAPDSFFATPGLDVALQCFNDMTSGKADVESLLARFKPFCDKNLALSLEMQVSAQTSAEAGEDPKPPAGDIPWLPEDDNLLAITIGLYTSDFGDRSQDLLPHRTVDDCEKRARYLSSRRCSDNPVKDQVHTQTRNVQPFSVEELAGIKDGLSRLDSEYDPNDFEGRCPRREVWAVIQKDVLPNRDWRQLEKMWDARQASLRYKRKYRANKNKLTTSGDDETALTQGGNEGDESVEKPGTALDISHNAPENAGTSPEKAGTSPEKAGPVPEAFASASK